MAGGIGSTEIIILLALFFILFGAERLPKMARAMGQSKGEFHKGLEEVTSDPKADTITDLEAGGRTPEQALFERAKNVGLDPVGMDTDELSAKIEALENLGADE